MKEKVKMRLVDANGLLDELFPKESRPSMRWLMSMTRRGVIPSVRISHLVLFDVEQVRRIFGKGGNKS